MERIVQNIKRLFGIRSSYKLSSIKNSIIIFDNLEKSSINLNEVLSFIENFTVQNKIKTILIANENNISKLYNIDHFKDRYIINNTKKFLPRNSYTINLSQSSATIKTPNEPVVYNELKSNLFGLIIDYKANC